MSDAENRTAAGRFQGDIEARVTAVEMTVERLPCDKHLDLLVEQGKALIRVETLLEERLPAKSGNGDIVKTLLKVICVLSFVIATLILGYKTFQTDRDVKALWSWMMW